MDQDPSRDKVAKPNPSASAPSVFDKKLTRRRAIQLGLAGAAGLAGVAGAGSWAWLFSSPDADAPGKVFHRGAPSDEVWELWRKRGWVREGRHYLKVGRNLQCRVCPNHCLLEPGDRSHCRNKIHRDGKIYTMAYANPCALHIDPVEKKPLFHFLPGSTTLSLATAGCVLRCLNCQNWEISQKRPEETKDAGGPEYRLRAGGPMPGSFDDVARMSLFPADAAALARSCGCPSISYTYSEPVAYYEYTYDTCAQARAQGVRNVLVTSGSIEEEALRDLARNLDAAHVDLKGFTEKTYRKLNCGSLKPILNTLKTLKSMGVWFEIINLVVPTYTDDPDTIRRMCDWLVRNIGPDHPIHFSRFHGAHKLTHLPPTPVDTLLRARSLARAAGLRYVYVGNVSGVDGAETTFCPRCRKPVIERDIYYITNMNVTGGKCRYCQTPIAGVWS